MIVGVTLLLTGLTVVSQAEDSPAKAPPPQGPFAVLVGLVGAGSPDAIRQAEAAHAALAKEGAAPVAASYALALVYVRENKLDLAAKTLDALPNQAKYTPPVLRLWLYLALEREEKALAAKLVPLLRAHVQSEGALEQEQLQTARLLGGVIGALPAGESGVLPVELIAETGRDLSAHKTKSVGNAFHLAQSEAAKRREKLAAALAKLADNESTAANFDAVIAERDQAAMALDVAKDKLAATLRANKEAAGETTSTLRRLVRQIHNLESEWERETPGRPRPPIRPKPPVAPARPTTNDQRAQDDYRRRRDAYEDDYRDYRLKLLTYENDQRTYAHRLQAWQQQDTIRRENLKSARKSAEEEVATTREAQARREKELDVLREDVKRQSAELQELEFKAHVVQSVASGETAKSGWLSRPSHYGFLWFATERQRLLQAAPK